MVTSQRPRPSCEQAAAGADGVKLRRGQRADQGRVPISVPLRPGLSSSPMPKNAGRLEVSACISCRLPSFLARNSRPVFALPALLRQQDRLREITPLHSYACLSDL